MARCSLFSSLLFAAALLTACTDAPGQPGSITVSPSPLTTTTNYAGEWAGGWRTLTCEDVAPRFGYCLNNVARDFEYLRLVLTQSGPRIMGRIQTRAGQGNVGGVVDELGRLRLGGHVIFYDSNNRLATRIVRWHTASTFEGFLVGGLVLEHVWGDTQLPAAVVVGELTDSMVRHCPGPKFTGFFWEC